MAEELDRLKQAAAQIAEDVHLHGVSSDEAALLPPNATEATRTRYKTVCPQQPCRPSLPPP